MGVYSRKVIEMNCFDWLAGLVSGDGYLDDRHTEIHNTSQSILREAIASIKIHVPIQRIKADIYGKNPASIEAWANALRLPTSNVRLKRDASPWKSNSEKIRIRVALKKLAEKLFRTIRKAHLTPSFARGLFDAEASVDSKGYIEFKQVSTRIKSN